MRNRIGLLAFGILVLILGAGACRKFVTYPVTRNPVISSVVAFPAVLGPGDSTMVTVFATDPDGDPLVYDWSPYNGLTFKGQQSYQSGIFNTHSNSMVFYRSATQPALAETAFVWCEVRDQLGGGASRVVIIVNKN